MNPVLCPVRVSADKTMMVTKGITCNNCDVGNCPAGSTNGLDCTGGAFYRVDQTYRGSSWLHNWLGKEAEPSLSAWNLLLPSLNAVEAGELLQLLFTFAPTFQFSKPSPSCYGPW
jgi:hypothetical protein